MMVRLFIITTIASVLLSAEAFQSLYLASPKSTSLVGTITSSTKLFVFGSDSNNNDLEQQNAISRRDVGNTIAAETAAFASIFSTRQQSAHADVKDDKDETSREIEFAVENVDGESGKTGRIVIRTRPSWSPNGVQRFEKLTEIGFWDNCRIFRVLPGFICQFGINGNPTTQALWRSNIQDDPGKFSAVQ